MTNKRKKVFVTGCFDMLHSGHVTFLNEALIYGDVYIGIGSDKTIKDLKGRFPVNNQDERKYMLNALKCVKQCTINIGSGLMDFIDNPDAVGADILFVNEDGHSPEKEEFCKKHNIEYVVSRRIPYANLPIRSTTTLRVECNIPFRIDLAGGWLDQPYISKYFSGPVLTISIEPTVEFNDRSGMASSTRMRAIELWHTDIPAGDKEKYAKTLFSYENPPGTEIISGSQDSLGIVLPGLNKLFYDGKYWPAQIESVRDEKILQFIENHLYLITLEPRLQTFSVLDDMRPSFEGAKYLADSAVNCWDAILQKDIIAFGKYFTHSFEAQIIMFPRMVDENIKAIIEKYRKSVLGWKLSGAGGGGYLILISEKPIERALKIKIRRGE